jgi:hypothetical protein
VLFDDGKLFLIDGGLTVVTALDPGGWLRCVEKVDRPHAVENHNETDGFETGQNERPVLLAVDRIKFLEIIGRLVAVESDDQDIAQLAGAVQIVNVSTVQDIKTSIGGDNAVADESLITAPGGQGVESNDFRIHAVIVYDNQL